MMSARMQRALAEAVAQPPPSRFGGRLGGPGRRGGLWLLICSVLVAAAAVALVLLTGFGQRSGHSTPQQTPASTGVPSSPAALHRHAAAAPGRTGLTHAAAGDAARAAAGVGGGVQSAGHTAAQPTASTPSAHVQAPAANPRPTTKSKAKQTPKPTQSSSPTVTHYSRTVPGTQAWTGTGIALRAGDRVSLTASGEVLVGPANGESPAGDPSCTPAQTFPTQSAQFPAPDLPCWSLIGRIGSGAPFEVGTSTKITATSGKLYLGVNANSFPGNAGSWAADITVSAPPVSS